MSVSVAARQRFGAPGFWPIAFGSTGFRSPQSAPSHFAFIVICVVFVSPRKV